MTPIADLARDIREMAIYNSGLANLIDTNRHMLPDQLADAGQAAAQVSAATLSEVYALLHALAPHQVAFFEWLGTISAQHRGAA